MVPSGFSKWEEGKTNNPKFLNFAFYFIHAVGFQRAYTLLMEKSLKRPFILIYCAPLLWRKTR
jgi:hypothetical protein